LTSLCTAAAQQACANYTLEPEYYPYTDTSFLGKEKFIQAGSVNYSYFQFGPLNVSRSIAGKLLGTTT